MKYFTSLLIAVVLLVGMLMPAPVFAATIPEGTVVQVRLLQELKSGRCRKGDQVPLEVAYDVLASDQTVLIRRGMPVVGTVTRSRKQTRFGRFGRTGKVEFTIDYIKFGDGVRVPLRTTLLDSAKEEQKAIRGKRPAAEDAGAVIVPTPYGAVVRRRTVQGRSALIRRGEEFTVYVDAATELPTFASQDEQ